MKPKRIQNPTLLHIFATVVTAGVGLTCAADLTSSDSAHAASPPGSIDFSAFLPADRATVWNPGMMGVGGIPVRSTVCSTLTPRGGCAG